MKTTMTISGGIFESLLKAANTRYEQKYLYTHYL